MRSSQVSEHVSRQEVTQPGDELADPEAQVVRHLLHNPDFFERNPQVLQALEVPHRSAGAVSLIERQVQLLRRQLETERNRLAHFLARAREYEALTLRIHQLVLKLIAARDIRQLCALIQSDLAGEFSADAVALKLFDTLATGTAPSDPLTLAFSDFIDRHHALCGPLDTHKAALLFGQAGTGIQSAALIPLQAGRHSGILAIGSHEPERFPPDTSTDLLDRIGELISHKLHVMPLSPSTELGGSI